MRAGLDGVPGLIQELADVADALVDRLGPDAEQDSYGDLGQRQALIEGAGQEPVGQGQDRAAAGAGSGQPRAVAAALVLGGLPLLASARLVMPNRPRSAPHWPRRSRHTGDQRGRHTFDWCSTGSQSGRAGSRTAGRHRAPRPNRWPITQGNDLVRDKTSGAGDCGVSVPGA